ncbi:MAG: hypothetical protein LBC92_05850 [Rickettsiales bacterium]|jgi:hypothetical protein|nr:hypothetical protein [Rickettsiales bacterium]
MELNLKELEKAINKIIKFVGKGEKLNNTQCKILQILLFERLQNICECAGKIMPYKLGVYVSMFIDDCKFYNLEIETEAEQFIKEVNFINQDVLNDDIYDDNYYSYNNYGVVYK